MASVPPSDLVINGLDLTTVFSRYISGPKASPTGIFINGQDLCNIFAPYQIGAKANPTGIYVGGGSTDLCNIFLPLNAAVPIAPTNLTLQSITDVSASFTFSTVAGATSYLASTTTGITGASISTPLVMTGLSAGTLYTVSLRTINPWGMSNPTKSINVTTFPVTSSLTTTISDVSMTVVYPTFNTLTYYTAIVTPTLGGSPSTFTSTTATLSITGLTVLTGYNIVYLASNITGISNIIRTTITTYFYPPTNLSLSNITSSSASLSFSTAVGATSYLIKANQSGSTNSSTTIATSPPINLSGLSNLYIYNVSVNSININNNYSPPVSISLQLKIGVTSITNELLIGTGYYTLYKFTQSGSITFAGSGNIYYCIVGGGGSGACNGKQVTTFSAGGGGGGGVNTGIINQSGYTTYTITVGNGGAASSPSISQFSNGNNGSISSIAYGLNTIYAPGGNGGLYIYGVNGGLPGETTKNLNGVYGITETGSATKGGDGNNSSGSSGPRTTDVTSIGGYTITINSPSFTGNYAGGGSAGSNPGSANNSIYGGGEGSNSTGQIPISGLPNTGGGSGGSRSNAGVASEINSSTGGSGIVLIFF